VYRPRPPLGGRTGRVFPLKDNIPTRRFAVLTVALIAANVIIYFLLQEGGLELPKPEPDPNEQPPLPTGEWGAIPREIADFPARCGVDFSCPQAGPEAGGAGQAPTIATLFTAMFMHGSILHLAGNMLFLWIFGNNIEDSMSRWRFLAFYLAGGLVATAAQTAIDPNSTIPTIGASGAVAAVLGAYLLLFPRARVVTVVFLIIFFTFLELPAVLVLGLWFLLQLAYGAAEVATPVGGEGGGVAYFAHIGGFLFGLLLIKLIANDVPDDPYARQRVPVY
jgi:membrane associated rhomboid family serine protease